MRGTTPAQIRQETGLRHHPTFNELIDQYKEGGPKIPWNDDPELILRSPAIASLSGMAAAADDRIRDQMALDRRNYFIREEARKQGLDFHTVRGFMDTVAPWADHNKPMDDDEWDQMGDGPGDGDEDMPPPPTQKPPKDPQRFDISTPRGDAPRRDAPSASNQAPPKPPPPPPRGTGFAAPAYSGMDASFVASGRTSPGPTQAASSSSQGPPPPPTPGREAQARGEDGLFHLHMQHQAAQMERYHASTTRWLEHLLNQVEQMGRRHDEQNRAMQALHSKQNTMEDLLARRMSETRQAAEQAEQQRAQMTDARFQQMLGQIERLAAHQGQQQQSVEIMRLLQGYLSEHLHNQGQAAQMQGETLNALSQKLGEVENALQGMGKRVSESTQGALYQLHQALREHKVDMREGISAGLQQQEQARQAFSKDAVQAFADIQKNLSGLGAQTAQMIQETQAGVAATQAGMETLNTQQVQQAAMTTALAQMQQTAQTQHQELRSALGRLGERQQQVIHGLMYALANPQMLQMNQTNQLQVFQMQLGVSVLNQVQREVLLALAGNKAVKPESLTYLLNQMDNSETSHLIKLAAQSQQAQLAIEDLPLPGAAAASSSQAPNPIPAGLTPRLPDGATLKSSELKPVNSVGLRQASPSPKEPPPPPNWYPRPMKGLERPSVSVSREIARYTAGAIKGDITLPEAKSRSLQARSDAIVARQVKRERSRQRSEEVVLANSTPKPPPDDAPMGVRITRKQKRRPSPEEVGVLANSTPKPPPDNPPMGVRKEKSSDAAMVPANRRLRSPSDEPKNYKKSKPRRGRAVSQVVTGSSRVSQSDAVARSASYKKK